MPIEFTCRARAILSSLPPSSARRRDELINAFAVRQIVPATVKVTYGPGADPNALVDWKGGQTWNRVLLAAVKPLGLRLVLTHTAVEIRK